MINCKSFFMMHCFIKVTVPLALIKCYEGIWNIMLEGNQLFNRSVAKSAVVHGMRTRESSITFYQK